MLILLGILGLLQSTVLPGLLVRKAFRLRGGIVEQMIRLFPVSLITNYLVIFFLAALRIYTRPAVLALIAAEIILICWFYRDLFRSSVGHVFGSMSKALLTELQPLRDSLSGDSRNHSGTLRNWIWLISGCFALSGVVWGIHLCRLNFGTVFTGWDTVFSWNRYAEIWAGGSVPNIGGMYPQLVSSNWSLSYVLQGEGAVQFFNTLMPPLFFLMIQLMLFDLGFQRQESGFFFAAVIARFMMKKLMGDQLFDGYMDVPAAAMSLLAIYTLIRAEKKDLTDQRQAILLSLFFASGAAVTKQSGFAAFIVTPIAADILLHDAMRTFTRKQKAAMAGAMALIVFPWYLHCFLYNTHGYEREIIADGIMDYNRNFNIQHRIRLAADTLGKYGVLFLLSAAGIPFVPKKYRLIFSLMIWPQTIIWAISYSYDARNLGPVLPFVSLMSGLSLAGIGEKILVLLAKIHADHVPFAVLCVVTVIAVLGLAFYLFPDSKLKEDQKTKQKALFGERLNYELLYNILGETHEGNDLYTDYPAWFLPGYAECCSSAELTDTYQVRQVLEEDKINWMLLPVIMPNNTDPSKELIEKCIADGKCEQIRCSDGYYKSYCLYQIHR